MNRNHKQRSAHWIRVCVAIVCLAVGLAGLVLPILPGVPLLIVGVLLLRRRTASTPRRRRSGLSTAQRAQLAFWRMCQWLMRCVGSREPARHRGLH